MEKWFKKDTKKTGRLTFLLLLLASCLFVYLFLRFLLPFFLPFLISYWIAGILTPAFRFLKEKLHYPPGISAFLLILVFFLLISFLLTVLFGMLQEQTGKLFYNIPILTHFLKTRLTSACGFCDNFLHIKGGSSYLFIQETYENILNAVRTHSFSVLPKQAIGFLTNFASFAAILFLVLFSSFLILKDRELLTEKIRKNRFYPEFHYLATQLSNTGMGYLKTQGILFAITAVICTFFLFLTKNQYAILIGILIAFLDALPMIGSGLVLIPWFLFALLAGNTRNAALLFTAFLFCQIIRDFLEPKLLGNRLNIPPLVSLFFLYTGLKLFGIPGVILGPASYVMVRSLLETLSSS